MKLIYVVIDGMGDLPIEEMGNKTPLEAANTPNMDFLAKIGRTGLMYTVGKGIAPESDAGVISILGYDPFKYYVSRGVLECIGAGLAFKDGDLALRCNFATLGVKSKILDRRAGRNLTTKEACSLAKSINNQIQLVSYPANFHFKNTISHRGVLVIRAHDKKISGSISNTDPAYRRVKGIGVSESKPKMVLRKCKPLDKSEEAEISANLVNEFTQKSKAVLDKHEINKKRVKEGKPEANVILVRDAGHLIPRFQKLKQKYNLSFACQVDMPVERGISKVAGMQIVDLPPSSDNLERDYKLRAKNLLDTLRFYNCVYTHIKGPDEPAHDGNFNLKTQLIAAIDKHFIKYILRIINIREHIICITADHATPCKLKVHTDDPVPILISGNKIRADKVKQFSERKCKNGDLGFLLHGTELMPKLVTLLRK